MVWLSRLAWFAIALTTLCKADPRMRDERAVHDLAELRFDAVSVSSPWAIMEITPAPGSGGSTVSGAVIDGATGRFQGGDKRASGQMVLEERGSWRMLEALDPYNGPRRGNYTWTKPYLTHQHSVDPDDIYAPFAEGGIVLCRLDARLGLSARPQAVFLIPAGELSQVREAYQSLKQSLSSGTNGLSGVLAIRALAERGKLTAEAVRHAWNAARGLERSALVYLLLAGDHGRNPAVGPQLQRQAREATAVERESMALGVVVARRFHPELYEDPLTESVEASLVRSGTRRH